MKTINKSTIGRSFNPLTGKYLGNTQIPLTWEELKLERVREVYLCDGFKDVKKMWSHEKDKEYNKLYKKYNHIKRLYTNLLSLFKYHRY